MEAKAKVDAKGRITVPKSIRDALGLACAVQARWCFESRATMRSSQSPAIYLTSQEPSGFPSMSAAVRGTRCGGGHGRHEAKKSLGDHRR
jgi:DNA-binding transcriptional regulator/RsmH inhibitor MraZ